jgi:hypothetical protein
LIPQLDFVRPSTWSHPVTWERVTKVQLLVLLLVITCVSDVQMSNASPF